VVAGSCRRLAEIRSIDARGKYFHQHFVNPGRMRVRLLRTYFRLGSPGFAYDCGHGEEQLGADRGEMPGLDIAEQRSWQHFLDAALRLHER
jgi:hypothetical protein